jgi:exopolysaccharide production protein ExoQ
MGSALPSRLFLLAWFWAIVPAELASLLRPNTAMNAGHLAMIGIFGSKNSFGLTQGVLILASTWILFDHRRSWVMRGISLGAVILGFLMLIAGRSADAAIAAIGALFCSFVAVNVVWFPRRWRLAILYGGILSTVLLFAVLLVVANEFDLGSLLLGYTGKDATLTGRTYLWEIARRAIAENPLLGTGYQAFWVDGNPYAEFVWTKFGGHGGFHFHNLWYQVSTELGYFGLCLAIVTVVGATLESIRWVSRAPNAESGFFLAYVVFTVIRTVVEFDLFSQFSFTWVLFVSGWACARQSRGVHPPFAKLVGK